MHETVTAKTWTTHTPGLRSKVRQRDGRRIFYATVSVNKKRHTEKAGSAPADSPKEVAKALRSASTVLGRMQGEVDRACYVPAETRRQVERIKKSQRWTFDKLRAAYLKANRKMKSVRWYTDTLNTLGREGLFPRFVDELTRPRIMEYRNRRRAERSNSTVNNELAVLRAMLQTAVDLGLIAANPAARIKKLPVTSAGRALTSVEVEQITEAAREVEPEMVGPFVFGVATGARPGEISRLDWADVDLSRGRVVFRRTKNKGRDRAVPLSTAAAQTLRDQPSRFKATGPVFLYTGEALVTKNPGGRPRRRYLAPFSRVIKASGVEGRVRLHDCRHTYATNFVQAGGDLYAVQKLCGWSSLKMVDDRYGHEAPGYLQDAVAAVDSGRSLDADHAGL